jgi:hypothetical protein
MEIINQSGFVYCSLCISSDFLAFPECTWIMLGNYQIIINDELNKDLAK